MAEAPVSRPLAPALQRLAGLALLFAVVAWAFHLHLPVLVEGYFDAGDDHIHAAYTNELVRIWEGEDRLLGWGRLYGSGFPIFLLRPPGLYFAVGGFHELTGISVEESLKLVVILGFCLFPLTVFAGSRLLGLGFWPAVFAGMLSPLPISLWGHTIDAYHYLGVHKQLLAILLFPPTLGALWRLLRDGTHGLLFAALFPLVMLTHPYIGYCLALLPPAMLLALLAAEPGWDWRRRVPHALLWALPTLLLCLIWLVPFYLSTEIQSIDPFLGVRKSFDVVVSTSAETLRQLFLGGVLDTTRWSGTFGGSHEWGWLDNGENLRLPVVTFLCLAGWLAVFLRPRSSSHAFLSLAFLISLVLVIGPDDFPILDRIPFAVQFQNVHAIFLFDWVAVTLGGVGCHRLFVWAASLRAPALRTGALALVLAATAVPFLNALHERTRAGAKLIDVRNWYTENGRIRLLPDLQRSWVEFKHVVDRIEASPRPGAVAIRSSSYLETVLYNLLPHMVDRPVFTSGFQKVGGVYPLLRGMVRNDARTNPHLQRLYDVRFVVTRTGDEKSPEVWPDHMRLLHANRAWELREVLPEHGPLDALPPVLVGFAGSEREWAALMKTWLTDFRVDGDALPWIVNFVNTGLTEEELARLAPYLRSVIVGDGATVPSPFAGAPSVAFRGLDAERAKLLRQIEKGEAQARAGRPAPPGVETERLEVSRARETFRVHNRGDEIPVLLKRAFYRGWRIEIDGEPAPIFRVSPGFQMVLVPPGEHELAWYYTGPNGWAWAKAAFLAGVLLALVLWGTERRLFEARVAPERAAAGPGRLVPSAVWGLLLVVLAYQTWSEAVLRRPVPIRPPGGGYAIEPYQVSRLDVYWNYVVGIPTDEQEFRVEIAQSPDFEEIFSTRTVDRNFARFRRPEFEPGAYWYRVRLELGDEAYAWTRPVRFVVEN